MKEGGNPAVTSVDVSLSANSAIKHAQDPKNVPSLSSQVKSPQRPKGNLIFGDNKGVYSCQIMMPTN